MFTFTGQLQLPQLSPRYLSRSCCRDSPGTFGLHVDSQFCFMPAQGTELAIFALKKIVDFYRNQDTPLYLCFIDAKNAFDRVSHRTLAKVAVRQKCAIAYCEIVYLLL